jgi:hypothetical protein
MVGEPLSGTLRVWGSAGTGCICKELQSDSSLSGYVAGLQNAEFSWEQADKTEALDLIQQIKNR